MERARQCGRPVVRRHTPGHIGTEKPEDVNFIPGPAGSMRVCLGSGPPETGRADMSPSLERDMLYTSQSVVKIQQS